MMDSSETGRGASGGPPDPSDFKAFRSWLEQQPSEWSVVIAARAALRVLPLLRAQKKLSAIILPVFRATAIARFAAKYPNRAIASAAFSAAAAASAAASAAAASSSAYSAAYSAYSAYSAAYSASSASASAADAASSASSAYASSAYSAADADAQQLHNGTMTPGQLAAAPLWLTPSPARIGGAWQGLESELRALGPHWSIWIDWYNDVLAGAPHAVTSEAEDAAFTDVPGQLAWEDGAEAVNAEIARRLAEIPRRSEDPEIPDQLSAPVRVEERDGRISKASDQDSPLAASERDFRDWRDPVVDHIDELSAGDFSQGTNHSRIRDRLLAFGKLLPGDIADVKDRQFRIGYEIERFGGLIAAYRLGGEDMPALNAAQLEDLDRLRVALNMGISKLERWSEFRRHASEGVEGDADPQIVADVLDQMAIEMERKPKFFDPELPVSFRFLAEAARDPVGATKTVVYGAVKSAENLMSFLGRKAIGIGKKGADAVEDHISKAVAASLIAVLSSAGLQLARLLPQGWSWFKHLLATIGAG
jgi:hypothetical protein